MNDDQRILCESVREELPAFLRGELTGEQAEAIRQHLEQCPDCRRESDEEEKMLALFRRSLPQLQAPEGFAARLRERLARETAEMPTPEDHAPAASSRRWQNAGSYRPSQRYFAEDRLPLRTRLARGIRRSPYLAVSLALHGAAAAILVVLLVRMGDGAPTTPITTAGGGTQQGSGELQPGTEANPFNIQQMTNPWTERKDCPQMTVQAHMVAGGLQIDCPQLLNDGTLALVDAPELGCVKAYLPAADAVGSNATVKDSTLVIPQELAQKRLTQGAQSVKVRVIELNDRYEFWAEKRWEGFRQEYAVAVPVLRSAPLPGAHPEIPEPLLRQEALCLLRGRQETEGLDS